MAWHRPRRAPWRRRRRARRHRRRPPPRPTPTPRPRRLRRRRWPPRRRGGRQAGRGPGGHGARRGGDPRGPAQRARSRREAGRLLPAQRGAGLGLECGERDQGVAEAAVRVGEAEEVIRSVNGDGLRRRSGSCACGWSSRPESDTSTRSSRVAASATASMEARDARRPTSVRRSATSSSSWSTSEWNRHGRRRTCGRRRWATGRNISQWKLELARPWNGCEMWAGGGRQSGRGRVGLVGRIGQLRSQNGRTNGLDCRMAERQATLAVLISSIDYNESIRDAHDIWTRIKTKFDESKHDSSFCTSTSFGLCDTNPCKEEEENDRWRPNDESTSPKGLSSHFDSHICCVANENDSGSTNEDEEEERSFMQLYARLSQEDKVVMLKLLERAREQSKARQMLENVLVGTCSQLQGDPTGVNSDVNRVLAQDGKSSVNLAPQGHCAGVFIGIRVPSVLC
jgi:hypothetical protein